MKTIKIKTFDHFEDHFFEKIKVYLTIFSETLGILLSIERKPKHFNNQSDCFKMAIKILSDTNEQNKVEANYFVILDFLLDFC